MSIIPVSSSSLTLESVHIHLMEWRHTRLKKNQMPQSLKLHIASLMGRYSNKIITQTLGISYTQLKKIKLMQMKALHSDTISPSPVAPPTQTFIKIPPIPASINNNPIESISPTPLHTNDEALITITLTNSQKNITFQTHVTSAHALLFLHTFFKES